MDIAWITRVIGPDESAPSTPQLCARAVVVLFLYGLLCMRIAGRRSFSSLSPFDIFIAIVVGSNISRVMTGKVPFIASLSATMGVVVMHRMLAMATMRSNWLSGFVKGKADVPVHEGVIDWTAMRRNNVSQDDLTEALRLQKIECVDDVGLATFERGEKISVISRSS